MSIHDLKKQLMELIENTNDEELLNLMKEDFIFYATSKNPDVTDELTEEQFNELKELAEEGDDKDVMTLEEFKKATERWRTR